MFSGTIFSKLLLSEVGFEWHQLDERHVLNKMAVVSER